MRVAFSRKSIPGWLAALLLLCCALPASAEVNVPGIDPDPQSGITMRITSTFKQIPQSGFVALQIYIHNTSGQARTWTFNFTGSGNNPGSIKLTRDFTVQNNAEQTFEVLAPLSTNTNGSYPSNSVGINASGYGLSRGFALLESHNSTGRTLTDFVLMSQGLAVRSWGPLDKECSDKGNELQGCDFNPNYLPTDWRAYIGVGSLWITDSEWQGLDPVLRNAIREWVLQGGTLVICTSGEHETADFGFQTDRPGYGRVTLEKWDGKELNASHVRPLILSHDHSVAADLADGYQSKWGLIEAIGHLNFNGGFIMLFVVCFGIVIGPLNLFWFAKAGRRHRLFWTTPLISIGGSILLAIVIFLQDGVGGTGNRILLVQLIPGDNEAVVVQEQVSRTGLLLSSRFESEEKIFLAPITELPAVAGIGHAMSPKRDSVSYTTDGRAYGGDWFISRSMQAQLAEAIRPSRSRIEVIPGADGAAPVLLSSVENDLKQVFYIDDGGKYWQTDAIRVGEKKTMQGATQSDFYKWLAASRHDAGARINYLLDQSIQRHGWFFAVADDPKGDAVPTMSSIKWKTAKVIYLGPCAVQKGVPAP